MSLYRLHYFPESGNSYKLALMLALCQQKFELVWTDFGSRVTWTAEWRARFNPMGEIPVLEEDGQKLTQTGPILLRLSDRYQRFAGGADAERFEVLRWLFWDNQKLSAHMATYRFMRTFSRKRDDSVLAYLRGRIDDFLTIVDRQVSLHPFIAGREATIADLSTCAYLSFPADEIAYDLGRDYPAVQAWLERISQLPDWRAPYDLLPGPRLPRFD